MPHPLTSSIAGAVATLAVVGVFPRGPRVAAEQVGGSSTRTIYASVTDKSGKAITDLQAADFEIKDAGKTGDIVSVAPAKIPLRIALLVADQGTGAFQRGSAQFIQKLFGHAEFALYSIVVQPEKVVDFSHDGSELNAGLARLGPRGRQIGTAQLMEGIEEATKVVQHEERRPAIVVMRLGGEGPTSLSSNDVREALRKSGAVLYVVSGAGAQALPPAQTRGTDDMAVAHGQFRDQELVEAQNNLNAVLGDGAKESGGRHDQVVTTTHAKALEQIAEELLNQYEIKYTLAEGVRPSGKISVTTKRKGATIHAPSRVSN